MTKNEDDPRPSDRLGGRGSPDKNNTSGEDVGGPPPGDDDTHTPLPVLQPAPVKHFLREEIVNEILDLTDQTASVALFGSVGVGKSFVARAVLDHDRTRDKYGENRHLMRCDNLTNSLEDFLERLSGAIHAGGAANEAQLRSHLESSPLLMLLLDGVDFLLDQLAPESEEISATIEEFGRYENVCLVTTSRTDPQFHGFHRVEVPTPSESDGRDIFYSLCDLPRSSALDELIARLDFHPLSIEHVARCVRENNWDEPMLLETWGDDRASALKANYYERLKDAIEPVLHSSIIKRLGTTARDVLEAIAAFPSGIRECQLEGIFHTADGIGEVVDVLCKLTLVHRCDECVKMISPFQFYFLESMIVLTQTEEVINVSWGPNCMPAPACIFFPFHFTAPCNISFSRASHIHARTPNQRLIPHDRAPYPPCR